MGQLTDAMNAQNDGWYGPNTGPGGWGFPKPQEDERD